MPEACIAGKDLFFDGNPSVAYCCTQGDYYDPGNGCATPANPAGEVADCTSYSGESLCTVCTNANEIAYFNKLCVDVTQETWVDESDVNTLITST